MAHGVDGSVLDEPPPSSRRERRRRSRPHAQAPEVGDETEPGRDAGHVSRQVRRKRAERHRFWTVLVPTVAGLIALTVLLGMVIRAVTDDEAGTAAPAGRRATVPSETLLLGHRAADGRIDLLVLAGTAPKSASVLMLPVATQVEVPSLGPQALADLPNVGDHGLLQTTVENLLGVKVAKSLVLDDAGLNAVLAGAAPIPVDLHRAVEFDGGTDSVIAAGPRRVSAAQAARLLTGRQQGSELDRLVTVQDVLDGWMRRLRDTTVSGGTLRVQPALSAMVAAARQSDRRTDTLPVESVTTGGGERFEPRSADVTRYANEAFPDALLAAGGSRPRVEILNGTGAVGLAQTIAARVVPAGGQVTLTGNVANFGLRKTQVVYYRNADRVAAQHLLRALGCGSLQKADTALGVVDVTILAGADCYRTGATPGT